MPTGSLINSIVSSDWHWFLGFFFLVIASWQAWRASRSALAIVALLTFSYAAVGALLYLMWPQSSAFKQTFPSWLYPWFLANQKVFLMAGSLCLVIALGSRQKD